MKATLLNKPEDYKRLDVNPLEVEVWEDGFRGDFGKDNWEWWYFDCILDDGTNAVIQFFSDTRTLVKHKKPWPRFKIKVTLPDGTMYEEDPTFNLEECFWGDDKCDVRYGNHHFIGDLEEYSIHVDPINGLGADLSLISCSKPFRPGSAFFNFGTEDKFYTWLCVVPKGEVSGTLTIKGKEIPVHGFGYHDHQWGNVNFHKEWNHWVWARQSFDDYVMLIFDMVSNKNTEFTRFPICFIQDKEGNMVFENTENVKCEVLEEFHDDEASDKDYPKILHYTFENNGKTIDYMLKMQEILENRGAKNIKRAQKLMLKAMGINPSYARFSAIGDLTLKIGEEEIKRSGNLIYEFMFPGETYKKHI